MEPNNPSLQPTEQISSYNKVYLIVIGLFILAGVACVSYVLGMMSQKSSDMTVNPYLKEIATPIPTKVVATPTPDPTANWQTYTDATYKFSMKYPSEYFPGPKVYTYPNTFSNSLYQVDMFLGQGDNLHKPTESSGDGLRIEIFSNPTYLNISDYLDTVAFKNDPPQWNNKNQPREIVQVANNYALRIQSLTGGAGGYGPVVFFASKGLVFEIEAVNSSQTNTVTFNQAIATFKFIQ